MIGQSLGLGKSGLVSLYAFFTDGYEKRMYRNFDTPSDFITNPLVDKTYNNPSSFFI